jgi:hypothetical protein
MAKLVKVGPISPMSRLPRLPSGSAPPAGCPDSIRFMSGTGIPSFGSNTQGVWQ